MGDLTAAGAPPTPPPPPSPGGGAEWPPASHSLPYKVFDGLPTELRLLILEESTDPQDVWYLVKHSARAGDTIVVDNSIMIRVTRRFLEWLGIGDRPGGERWCPDRGNPFVQEPLHEVLSLRRRLEHDCLGGTTDVGRLLDRLKCLHILTRRRRRVSEPAYEHDPAANFNKRFEAQQRRGHSAGHLRDLAREVDIKMPPEPKRGPWSEPPAEGAEGPADGAASEGSWTEDGDEWYEEMEESTTHLPANVWISAGGTGGRGGAGRLPERVCRLARQFLRRRAWR